LNVKDKVIVVTGASSGLGRHFSIFLASQGAKVAACARRLPLLEALVGEIKSGGGRAIALPLDVTQAESTQGLFEAVKNGLGTPDVLINNSGLTLNDAVLDQTESNWDAVLDTNLKGAFMLSAAFGRQWKAGAHPGCIINIASILGIRVAGMVAPYAVSKAGLIHLTQSMALELARHSIRVNAIAPGYVETDLNQGFFASPAGQAMLKRIPQRRLGRAEDLDGALLLLASDASAYMTGAVIPVDGGHLLSTL
jgi:NAD(P)-dependent dehydrogenase (short-subunit alcohol dehydrogenase family)